MVVFLIRKTSLICSHRDLNFKQTPIRPYSVSIYVLFRRELSPEHHILSMLRRYCVATRSSEKGKFAAHDWAVRVFHTCACVFALIWSLFSFYDTVIRTTNLLLGRTL